MKTPKTTRLLVDEAVGALNRLVVHLVETDQIKDFPAITEADLLVNGVQDSLVTT